MSELPKGWTTSFLNDLCSAVGGGTPSKSEPKYWAGGTIPWVSPKDMKTRVVIDSEDHVTEAALDRLSIVPPDSVLVVVRSGILSRTLPVAQTTIPVTVNQDMRAFVPHTGIAASFLAWQLLAKEREILQACSKHGTTVASIEGPALASFPVAVAPVAEQSRIVGKLEELLSDLDAGVAELKAAQKKLTQYRQSLLKAAVEGALTADWRRHNRPTETGAQLLERILTERHTRWEARQLAKFAEQGKTPPKDWQKKYPEPVQPDTAELPELPEGWVWASVEQLGDVQLGRQRSPDKLKGVSPTRYIRAANITESGIDFSDVLEMDFSKQERAVFELNAGDVLLTEASGSPEHVGRPAIWPKVDGLFCFQNTVLRFSPKGISSNYSFCSFFAMQKLGVFQKQSGGVGINHLSAGKFSRLAVALPSSIEQSIIVERLESAFASIHEQEMAVDVALKQSAAQRQNILRAAFSGQLIPQDPDDEPASVLLERIRAERATQRGTPTRRGRKREAA